MFSVQGCRGVEDVGSADRDVQKRVEIQMVPGGYDRAEVNEGVIRLSEWQSETEVDLDCNERWLEADYFDAAVVGGRYRRVTVQVRRRTEKDECRSFSGTLKSRGDLIF